MKVGDVWHGFAALTQNIQVTTAQAQAQGAGPQVAAADQPAKDAGPGAKPGEPQVASTTPLPTAKLPLDPTRFTQSDIDLLQALRERSVKLDERERDIDQRSAILKAAEKAARGEGRGSRRGQARAAADAVAQQRAGGRPPCAASSASMNR
ncbi:MAG: hypothetical protein WDO24_01945 [Pseudomonadota bacterium]